MIHCLFEQSGTFKNEFIKLGYEAQDYDILNDFGETDNVVDLFAEIEKAYCYRDSMFDQIRKDDLVMAFFPCTRFETQIGMAFRGVQRQMAKWDDEKKISYDMKLHKELHDLYQFVSMLAIVSLRKGFKLVIENPYSYDHYLKNYWGIPAKIIDHDRRESGDYYKKPTQYWFINFEPKNNLVFDYVAVHEGKAPIVDVHDKAERSLISKDYANRFIRTYLIDEAVENG